MFLPLREVVRPGQQGPAVLVQRVVFASASSGGLSLESLPTAGELVGSQMDYVKRIHHLGRVREDLVDGGGVAGEAIHGHHLHLAAEARVAFLQPGAQHFRTASGTQVQQSGRTTSVDQWGEVDEDGHQVRRLTGLSSVLPDMFIDAEDAHPVQVVRVVVDKLAAGIECDLVDQVPADAECFGGGRDTHPVNRQALEDPAGDAVGELGSVIRAGQGCLEDLPRTRRGCAQEAGNADIQAGGEADDGKINEPAEDVIA
ncbi:hypothetical protein FRC0421_02414 [Corynebacterium diphtheriae]|nr:hypothetical protein FRC0209_02416 [Corynebacterium diphtheriae]CAB0868295.1 hypothetical protein FRC0323_02419 [Corynebacterium diphtheriae]CAB0922520.1 hypothetical protein FRC0421_02414 [Corynebacterium diphtheriae]